LLAFLFRVNEVEEEEDDDDDDDDDNYDVQVGVS
jgi:hypothetical protein